jgi:antibiotic biosynthesis monooxygenase (ABM) superfamily enzyme
MSNPERPSMSSPVSKPSRLSLSFLVFLGVYPLVTLLGLAAQWLMPGWQAWERNLITVPIMVLTMVYGLIPLITKFLSHRAAPAAVTKSDYTS